MSNNMEDKRLENLKKNIAIYNFKEELKQSSNKNVIKGKENTRAFFIKIISTACASFLLVSGIVLATHMKNIKMSQEISKIQNISVKVNIENFDMNDSYLTTNILLEFDNNIKDKLNEVYSIELGDFIIRDEENRIIYCSSTKEVFEEYCKENNLDYTYGKFNENYINCGLYESIEYKKDNLVKLNYKIYSEDILPKSKKLYFTFETIKLRTLDVEQIVYEIKGNWNFTFNVVDLKPDK